MADEEPCSVCGDDIWLDTRSGDEVLPCRWCAAGRKAAGRLIQDAPTETRAATAAKVTAYTEDAVHFRPPDRTELVGPEKLAEIREATAAVAKDFRMP